MSIVTHHDLPAIRERHEGQKIVFCSGVFDLTHAGHILFFEDCKKHGDVLVVCVGNDAFIKGYKGAERPVLNEHIRMKTVASLKPVDYVFLDTMRPGEYPLSSLNTSFEALKPDIYVINTDTFDIPHRERLAKKFGAKLIVLDRRCPPEFEAISTTNIIEKIRRLAAR